ncbi:hypothetical protein LDG_5095 [Legionella drancourtii LLAP12]|uniref:Uncharacterized protein n=1 Tax=Legionella drancourtii LLAP12 TaxID=658187 RepID=G9EIT9_9GAMM|nr:hypothetical protein LDG_5095 [Legionella drancourtii LLAP12]
MFFNPGFFKWLLFILFFFIIKKTKNLIALPTPYFFSFFIYFSNK